MRYAIKERRHMQNLGGRRLPLSGRGMPWEDGVVGNFHVQLKITRRDYYDLSADALAKLIKHATIAGQEPLFVVFFERYNTYAIIYATESHSVPTHACKRIKPKDDEFAMHGWVWKVKAVPKGKAKDFIAKLGGRVKDT